MDKKFKIHAVLGTIVILTFAYIAYQPEEKPLQATYEDCIEVLKPEYHPVCEKTYNHGN